jgi:LysM repeat protein
MKILNLCRSAALLLAITLIVQPATGQVVVERSKDKVVISGVAYFIHEVKKGETVYSIAKAYGLTVSDLTKENPPALYELHAGQTLRIPVRLVQDKQAARPETAAQKHDDVKYIYHVMKPGETVYFLSKTYGVSENEIVDSNTGMDITKLSVGAEVAIPRKDFISNQQKFNEPSKPVTDAVPSETVKKEQHLQAQDNHPAASVIAEPLMPPQENGFFFHKVKSGESLSSIADLYGVTLRELKKANRDLRFPQVGDFVKVPGSRPEEKPVPAPIAKDTVRTPVTISAETVDKPSGFTPVSHLSGSLDIAVLLPFYLRENATRTEIDSSKIVKGKKSYKITQRDDSWIYPESVEFIEMYEGILLAADTLRSLGVNINLHTFDINRDTIELTRIIRDGKLNGMDLIIGPVYSRNLAILSDWAKEEGIPVVSPVPIYDNTLLKDNPNLFLASSTLEVAQHALAGKMKEYAGQNFIFVHADTLGTDEDVKRFKHMLLSEIGTMVPFEDIRFREFMFYSRAMFNNDTINKLEHTLSDHCKNVIIIASEEAPVISETIIDIHNLQKKYDIKVFGYPVLRDLDNLDPKYFFDLDMQVFSPYWVDYSSNDVMLFNSRFRQKFLTEPSERSFAWEGYDVAYYFISGIAIHGRSFLKHPSLHHPDLLQSDFDFRRANPDDGFENRKLYLVHFTKDYEVQLDDAGSAVDR